MGSNWHVIRPSETNGEIASNTYQLSDGPKVRSLPFRVS